jgi:hypothetical protein
MFGRKAPKTKNVPVGGSQGFGVAYAVHYTRHRQPDPGIAAYSYDTLALPLYTAIGWGVQNKRQFAFAPSNAVLYQQQAVGITTVGNPGNLAGTFVSTGLIDVDSSPSDIQMPTIASPGSFVIPQGM